MNMPQLTLMGKPLIFSDDLIPEDELDITYGDFNSYIIYNFEVDEQR